MPLLGIGERPIGAKYCGCYIYEDNLQGIPTSYGMPSGHAQSSCFSLTFLFLTTQTLWVLFGLCIVVLTLYQRYKHNRHTLTQLFVGSLIGIIFSCCVFYTTKYYLDSQTDKNVTLIYNVSKWLFKI